MKNIRKSIYFFLLLGFTICLGTFCWKLINLPLSKNVIVGNYSLNNYNSLNDVLGYITFITLPILFYIAWKFFFEKKTIEHFLLNIKFKNENLNNDLKIYGFCLFFVFFIIIEFLSVQFSVNEIDLFHEGARLSSAFKSKLDNSLWSGSYISTGIIYEILGPKYIWKIFNIESIGLLRFLDIFFVLVTKFILILLSLEISKSVNLNHFFKCIFFICLTIVLLSLTNYNSNVDLIKFREIPVLLTLLFFIKSLKSKKQLYTPFVFISFLAVTTFFWSIDRALVLNLFTIFIIIFLIINKSYKNIILIILSYIFFCIFFYFYLKEEFLFFTSNTITIFKEMSEINGFIHPIPFSDSANSSRSTKTILLILISLLISLSFFFDEKRNLSHRFKISLTSISLLSFLSYIYALGRTDYTHLKQVFGFPIIFFSCYLLFYLFHFIHHKNNLETYNNKKFFILLIPLITVFHLNFNIDYLKTLNFKSRFNEYIELADNEFLSKADNEFINQASLLIKDEKCIQLYSNDAALLYLLKKPNCTKYYFTWIIGSKKNQTDLINKLDNTNFIIAGGVIDKKMKLHKWGPSLDVKYPLLTDYIYKNFNKELIIDDRKFLFK